VDVGEGLAETSSQGSSLEYLGGTLPSRRSPLGGRIGGGVHQMRIADRARPGRGFYWTRQWTLDGASPSPWTTSIYQIAAAMAAAERSEKS
jgi:hypothetical protein